MHHAVGALLIVPSTVCIPVGFVHQLIEGTGVALAEQVAGLLPAEDGPSRIAPWRAMVNLVSGKKVEEQAGLAERPLCFTRTAVEDITEKLLGLAAIKEVLLVRCAFVGVAR